MKVSRIRHGVSIEVLHQARRIVLRSGRVLGTGREEREDDGAHFAQQPLVRMAGRPVGVGKMTEGAVTDAQRAAQHDEFLIGVERCVGRGESGRVAHQQACSAGLILDDKTRYALVDDLRH